MHILRVNGRRPWAAKKRVTVGIITNNVRTLKIEMGLLWRGKINMFYS